MKFLSLIVLSISVLISVTSCKKQETSLSQADIEKIAKEVAKYSQEQGVTSGETVEKLKEEAQALIDQDQTLTQEEKTKAKEVAREDFEKIEEKAQDLIGSSSWEKKREELLKAQDQSRAEAGARARANTKTQLERLLQSTRSYVKRSFSERYVKKNRNTPCGEGYIEGEHNPDGSKVCWIIKRLPREYRKGLLVDCYKTHIQFGTSTCKRIPCPPRHTWDGKSERCKQRTPANPLNPSPTS